MKKAKLKKQLLQAKEMHGRKVTALKKLSAEVLIAQKDFAHSKEDLKAARKKHKDAKKHFRVLQKTLKNGRAVGKEAQERLTCLKKKWRKVSKSKKKAMVPQPRNRGNRRKQVKSNIKVISTDEVAAT